MSGSGFATNDVVIQDLLNELGLVPTSSSAIDIFVIDAEGACLDDVLKITMGLREHNFATAFSYKHQSVNKQFKQVDRHGAGRVVVVAADTRSKRLVQLKDMKTGAQQQVTVDSLLDDPFRRIGS